MYPDYNMYNQYYGFREYNYRNSKMKEQSGEIITLNQAIDLIKKSVDDEKEDEMFYLISSKSTYSPSSLSKIFFRWRTEGFPSLE